jgi:hypothetical protein
VPGAGAPSASCWDFSLESPVNEPWFVSIVVECADAHAVGDESGGDS